MSCVNVLVAFGLRRAIGIAPGEDPADRVAGFVEERFDEPGRRLFGAIATANDRAWQALGIALAGDDVLDQIKWVIPVDDKGIRVSIQGFLQDRRVGLAGATPDSRKRALSELKRARQMGLLSSRHLDAKGLARHASAFEQHADAARLEGEAAAVAAGVAEALGPNFPNLGKLLPHCSAGAPPLHVSAFAYFFRREVEADDDLAHGLLFDGLRQLSAPQAKALSEVRKALTNLGDQFDRVFEQLGRPDPDVSEPITPAAAAEGTRLDMRAELAQLGELPADVRRVLQEVLDRVGRVGAQNGELNTHHASCIRIADERIAVRQLLACFRQLPPSLQQQVPSFLNGLGKLQFAIGDAQGAWETFDGTTNVVTEAAARAEVHFNAFVAAREVKNWDGALSAIQKAATLHPSRFAPFPVKRYPPTRILHADGYGTTFLCQDRNCKAMVVVKTLHAEALGRPLADVYRDVEALRQLHHPAIVGVRDCDYADRDEELRPYIVTDYFAGASLESYLQQCGLLSSRDLVRVARQIAQGVHLAHERGILHRGLRPESVLVRKEGDEWMVKVIDFGLSLGRQGIESGLVAPLDDQSTLDRSRAETIRYAPPEQTGQVKGVEQGPHSDVFSFGKLCYQALFRTTQPKERHWKTIPEGIRTVLKELLEHCQEEELEHRLRCFKSVLAVLDRIDPDPAHREPTQELPHAEVSQRSHSEQEGVGRPAPALQEGEPERANGELERLSLEGEIRLEELLRNSLERTGGKLTRDVRDAANELCRSHFVPTSRAKQIVRQVIERLHGNRAPEPVEEPRNALPNGLSTPSGNIPAKAPPKMFLLMTPALRGAKLAWIPPGSFQMGSPATEAGRSVDEKQQHAVTLTNGFLLGATSVTRGQFMRFVRATNYQTEGERNGSYDGTGADWKFEAGLNWRTPGFEQTDDHPVVCVNWYDAVAFCEWLSDSEKHAYRLPTEAEWEYACRAGTTTAYHTGETISPDHANYNMECGRTTPMGTFPANTWGVFDMHGNVWDWCADWYGPYSSSDGEVNPVGPPTGETRVLRGGSFDSRGQFVRSSHRNELGPTDRVNLVGFRFVRALE